MHSNTKSHLRAMSKKLDVDRLMVTNSHGLMTFKFHGKIN